MSVSLTIDEAFIAKMNKILIKKFKKFKTRQTAYIYYWEKTKNKECKIKPKIDIDKMKANTKKYRLTKGYKESCRLYYKKNKIRLSQYNKDYKQNKRDLIKKLKAEEDKKNEVVKIEEEVNERCGSCGYWDFNCHCGCGYGKYY